jgi:hypothetical protein
MQNVIYAATRCGYAVQVFDGSEVSYEYSAGNHQFDSQATTEPGSPKAVRLPQLRRWAKQTAGEIAKAQGIPANRVEYDPDLESTLKEWDACR